MPDHLWKLVKLVPLDGSSPKFFGFSEFLAGLALMVLAWTIADFRYKFRVKTAPLPLEGLTFVVVAFVGVLSLLTDLWRAQRWRVPQGFLFTPATWQSFLGGLFFLTFMTWVWFAFIRRPIYGRRNVIRYARELYRVILKGSPTELAVIADELAFSARSIVHYATDRGEFKNILGAGEDKPVEKSAKVVAYADDILLLIGDKRFCRTIIECSPGTALAIFHQMGETKKYGIQVEIFGKNIVNEAINNRDSFLYHESSGYESGLIGYHKPLSQAMFSNHRIVEAIGTLLDPDINENEKWNAEQWKAYCRAVLMTFRDYVEKGFWNHSFVLYRAKGNIERAAWDIYKLNGVTELSIHNDARERLSVIVEFIKKAVEILENKGVPDHLQLRFRKNNNKIQESFYDHLAAMIFEVIFCAGAVTKPTSLCWWIQHNTVWSELFNFNSLNGPAGKVVKFKARRLLYDEVVRMREFPNFKGAKILGFCLNVLGLAAKEGGYDRDSRALQRAVLSWTRTNYAWLHSYHPRVAESCLVDGMSYDEKHLRLVKTYPAEGLRLVPTFIYLNINQPPKRVTSARSPRRMTKGARTQDQ